MSSDPQNKQEEHQNNKSTKLLRLVSGVKKLTEDDKFFDLSVDLLNKYSFKILVTFFALYGTFTAMQNTFLKEADSSVRIDSTVVEKEDNEEPDEERSIGNYDHESITHANMTEVCNNSDFQDAKLGGRYPTDEYNITSHGAKYREGKIEVFPVFRWACKYTITEKEDNRQNSLVEESDNYSKPSGSELIPGDKWVGLSLDEFYCEGRLDTSAYLDFEDPYSWYCVNPDAKFGVDESKDE